MKKTIQVALFSILSVCVSVIGYGQETLRPTFARNSSAVNLVTPSNLWLNIFQNSDSLLADTLWMDDNDNSAILQGAFGSTGATLYTDLLTDNFGYVRVTLSGVVNTDRSDSASDLQTFLNGGGNAMLKGTLPISLWRGSNAMFGFYAKSALFFNMPALGGHIDDPQFGGQLQLEAQYSATGSKGLLGINIRGMAGAASGTGPWMSNLLENNSDVFSYGSIGFGLIIQKSYTLSFSKPFGITNADRFNKQKATITLSANF